MKRYDPNEYGYMDERADGDYIRHDDADLAALVEAADAVLRLADFNRYGECDRFVGSKAMDLMPALRAALSALAAAASGTTTRGGGE